MKEPKTLYNNKEVESGIKRYILKYIQSLNKILTNLERANYTISDAKSRFYIIYFKIVRYIYNIKGRRPDTAKIIKILKYKKSKDTSKTKIFIEIYVYYRI